VNKTMGEKGRVERRGKTQGEKRQQQKEESPPGENSFTNAESDLHGGNKTDGHKNVNVQQNRKKKRENNGSMKEGLFTQKSTAAGSGLTGPVASIPERGWFTRRRGLPISGGEQERIHSRVGKRTSLHSAQGHAASKLRG